VQVFLEEVQSAIRAAMRYCSTILFQMFPPNLTTTRRSPLTISPTSPPPYHTTPGKKRILIIFSNLRPSRNSHS
jgi:hypothetical protein